MLGSFYGKTDIKDWALTASPIWGTIVALIMKAKGKRSFEEFAKQCGSNGPKFSRIINQKVKKPLEPDLLEKIAENAENGDVPLSALLLANGYRPKLGTVAETQFKQAVKEQQIAQSNYEEHKATRGEQMTISEALADNTRSEISKKNFDDDGLRMTGHYSRTYRGDQYSNSKYASVDRVMAVRDILTSELMDRDSGVSVDIGRDATSDTDSLRGSGYLPHWDLRFNTEVYPEFRGWYIHVFSQVVKPSSTDLALWTACRKVLNQMACYFTTDAWQPELFQEFKCTFVYVNEDIYSKVKQQLNYAKTNNCFTMMLVDIENGEIKEEVEIGSKNNWSEILLEDIPEKDFYGYYDVPGQLSFKDIGLMDLDDSDQENDEDTGSGEEQ